jgi:DNA replication protein DnaC
VPGDEQAQQLVGGAMVGKVPMPPTIGQLAAEFAASWGLDMAAPRGPLDHDAIAQAYIADARLRDARMRWDAFAAENPQLVETEWERPQYEANREAIAKVLGWQYGAKGLLASGPTGRGKTRALVELFKRLACDEGRDVRYYFAGDWFAALQAQVNYGRDEARGWVEACAQRKLIIIDDLGQEAMQTTRADWAQGWLFRFLDLRISRGLPLIVSTNLSSREMAGRASDVRGDPLVRRFTDLCEIVKFK